MRIFKPVFTILFFSLFVFACNNADSVKEQTTIKDTLNTNVILKDSTYHTDSVTTNLPKTKKVLFIAHGSEPGWSAQICSDEFKLITDYGKDSLILKDTFSDLDNNNGYNYSYSKPLNGVAISLSFSIVNKPCISESSGDKLDRTVLFTLNKKQYKGCGNFVK